MKKLIMLAAVAVAGATFAGAADAAVSPWKTVATGAVKANQGEGITIGHTDRHTYGLRLNTRAPRGRVMVEAWTDCGAAGEMATTWSYWSSGRTELNRHRINFSGYGGRCNIVAGVLTLRGGYLTTALQRYIYSD